MRNVSQDKYRLNYLLNIYFFLARATLEAQLQRAIRGEMLPGELHKLLEGVTYTQTQSLTNQSDKTRVVVALLLRRLRASDESKRSHDLIVENALYILCKWEMGYYSSF